MIILKIIILLLVFLNVFLTTIISIFGAGVKDEKSRAGLGFMVFVSLCNTVALIGGYII